MGRLEDDAASVVVVVVVVVNLFLGTKEESAVCKTIPIPKVLVIVIVREGTLVVVLCISARTTTRRIRTDSVSKTRTSHNCGNSQ